MQTSRILSLLVNPRIAGSLCVFPTSDWNTLVAGRLSAANSDENVGKKTFYGGKRRCRGKHNFVVTSIKKKDVTTHDSSLTRDRLGYFITLDRLGGQK